MMTVLDILKIAVCVKRGSRSRRDIASLSKVRVQELGPYNWCIDVWTRSLSWPSQLPAGAGRLMPIASNVSQTLADTSRFSLGAERPV